MQMIALGMANKEFKGLPEGISVTNQDGSLVIMITIKNPTADEIKSIQHGSFDFGVVVIDNLPIATMRFDDKQWMDTLISSSEFYQSVDFEDDYGYATNIILADTETGVVHAMRCVGLSTEISRTIDEYLVVSNFAHANELIMKVFAIQNKYTTDDLVAMVKPELTYRFEEKQ